jgi:hypothetical protein
MISQKERLVFGIIDIVLATILLVCTIINLFTGSWGLAIFTIGVAGFDIYSAVLELRHWFRYKEAIKNWKPIADEDINGEE